MVCGYVEMVETNFGTKIYCSNVQSTPDGNSRLIMTQQLFGPFWQNLWQSLYDYWMECVLGMASLSLYEILHCVKQDTWLSRIDWIQSALLNPTGGWWHIRPFSLLDPFGILYRNIGVNSQINLLNENHKLLKLRLVLFSCSQILRLITFPPHSSAPCHSGQVG